MLEQIIQNVISHHPDFEYDDVKEICDEFLAEQPAKIKEETKLKRLNKYLEAEFELSKNIETQKDNNKEYSLETIPKYLFTWKAQISSSLINVSNLTKNIERTELFDSANFQINKTDKIALIGKNWAWKTTLLKMILKTDEELEPDYGNIELASGLKIWYLSQDLFWENTKNTLREEMYSLFPEINEKISRLDEIQNNMDLWDETEQLNKDLLDMDGFRKYKLQEEILKYFGFSQEQMDFNVLQLSGWEQTKVQIAKFLIQEVDLLILDEPTNHLDINGIIFLEKFCQNWQKAMLSISHDIHFINATSNKISEISNKKINSYPGNYEQYLVEKQSRFDKQMKDYTDQQRDLKKQNDYINRFRANSAKASSVQSRIKQLEKVDILEMPDNEITVNDIHVSVDKRLPEIIMKLHNVEAGYNYPIVTLPEYLEVNKSDKIGIIGENWAGKTTFLKTLLWDLDILDWEININETLKVGSYSQVLEDLNVENNILEELLKDHNNETEIRTMLGGLLIIWDKVEQKIKTLSGWERAKVALTKMLLVKPHIIVMDEPTNHLDIHSKQVIKKMLESFEGTTLIVSHDRDILESISNKIWLVKWGFLNEYREVEKGFEEIYK